MHSVCLVTSLLHGVPAALNVAAWLYLTVLKPLFNSLLGTPVENYVVMFSERKEKKNSCLVEGA